MATSSNAVPAVGRTTPLDSPARRRAFGKLFIPSLADFFFIALTAWLFITGDGWKGLLLDADTGWHIRTGDYIVATGTVPHHDLFSFSKPNQPWFAWEWLSDVLYSGLFHIAGLKGIVLWSGLLITGSATILLRFMIARGANLFIALFTTLLIIGGSSIHYHARPHVITLLFLALSTWWIDADRRRNTKWIWGLVPFTILWTNLHGGFLVLMACLGLVTIGTAIEEAIATGWTGFVSQRVRRYALLTALCGLASLGNPYGIGLHQHIYDYLRSDWIKNVIQEFQSPSFRSESMLQFEVLLFAGLIAVGFVLQKRQVTEALLILYFAQAALGASRHVPIYLIVASPIIVGVATEWWNRWVANSSRGSIQAILNQISNDRVTGFKHSSVWCLAFVLFLSLQDSPKWPKDFPDTRFPVKLTSDHGDRLMNARLFTTDQWGDYLLFRYYPRQKVWVDGRSDFYGPEIGKQYQAISQGERNWEDVLVKNKFDTALVPVNWPVAQLLRQRADWRVIAEDDLAVLLVQTPGETAGKALEKKPDPGLMKKTNTAESTRRQTTE